MCLRSSHSGGTLVADKAKTALATLYSDWVIGVEATSREIPLGGSEPIKICLRGQKLFLYMPF